MGRISGLGSSAGWGLLPQLSKAAPDLSVHFVREALRRAITGVGKLQGAPIAADRVLGDVRGDVDLAIHELIEDHVRYAGLQGFATNLGGLTTAAVLIPANITGLALIECRLVACIAHLRGYDLDDQRVRNAILTCTLGEDGVQSLVRKHKLPTTPMGIATAPAYDEHMDRVIAAEVTSELLSRIAGKRMAATVGRRVPVVGGVIGAGADGFATWQIGRYADRELLPRTRR
jgi:hypothetical protein